MKYIIGVDLGTQGAKAVMLDEQGGVIGEAFEESRLIYPEAGAVEQDPEEMLGSVLRAVRTVVQSAAIDVKQVAGIGIDGQMAGIMGVGKDGMAATPYDSWLDTRCGKYRGLYLDYGEDEVISITGAPVTYAHGPKILWWKHERPSVYKKIRRFVQPAAYCVMRMCGLGGDSGFVDHTYLHFSGFADTARKRWSQKLLSALEISPDKMPAIVKPYDKMGGLTAETARECGLLSGTPVVAGCGDTAASSFGAGIVRSGLLFDVAGTASVFACATDVFASDVKHKTIMYAPSVVDGLYTPMAYISGGGMCLKWLRDEVLNKAFSYRELDEMAARIACGSDNLIFMPHFSGRTCPNDALVRGGFFNLSWNHTSAHMYRAIMESIAYEYGIYADIIRDLSPGLKFERVISVGGGSKSRLFGQIKSDALGVPFSTISLSDTASLGCCAIAGYGVGLYGSLGELVERVAVTRNVINPVPGRHDFYARRKDIYADIIPALHNTYKALGQLEMQGG